MLSLYLHNSSRQPYYFIVQGEHQPPLEGTVQNRPASAGCGPVGRDWELMVWQAPARPEPDAEMLYRTSGEAFGNPDTLALWLTVDENGTVATGRACPCGGGTATSKAAGD